MTLIVEDGTGRADAESFISVADAATYFTARGKEVEWDAVQDQEACLRLATDFMQGYFGGGWKGFRTTQTQALDWPRFDVWHDDARAFIGSNTVPPQVKYACAELALKAASGELAPDVERLKARTKVGPIEVEYDPSSPILKQYVAVARLVAHLRNGTRGGGMFAKVIRT